MMKINAPDKHKKKGSAAQQQDKDKPAAGEPPGVRGAGGRAAQTPQQWYEAQGHVRWVESAHTTGAGSRAFTSTVSEPTTRNQLQLKRFERNPTKKGYARLHTNLGEHRCTQDGAGHSLCCTRC